MNAEAPRAVTNPMISPIDLEIYWNRLIAIADEAGAALKRTSFSTVVRESNDFACVILDAEGRLVAQSSLSVAGFIGTGPLSMRHMLQAVPGLNWRPTTFCSPTIPGSAPAIFPTPPWQRRSSPMARLSPSS